ncbi:UNVERIFIED_CONTAM: carbohydrate binding protein [Acetivibrio alkalicellulosi]
MGRKGFVLHLVVCILLQLVLGVSLLNVEVHGSVGSELVQNGSFDSQNDNWLFQHNSILGADAYSIVRRQSSNNFSLTGIRSTGHYDWSIQLIQNNISISNSRRYLLSFEASSTVPRKIGIDIIDPVSYRKYFSEIQNIDTSKKRYEFEFVINTDSDLSCQLTFNMGKVEEEINEYHEIMLDRISLKVIEDVANDTVGISTNINLSRSLESTQFEFGEVSNMMVSQYGSMTIPGKIEAPREIVLVIDNSGSYYSYAQDIVSPFDYGIYASENLHFQGNNAYINGSTYAKNFSNITQQITITGTCAAFNHYIAGNYSIGDIKTVSAPVEMPYFHTNLISQANANARIYDPVNFPPNVSVPMPGQPGVHIRYEPAQDVFRITADASSTFVIDSSMYFKANLIISLNNVNNISDGFLVADGDIIIQGHQLNPSGPNDKLFVYSIEGNIRFQTSFSSLNGIAYAPGSPLVPDSGKIIFQGIDNTINGSLAAKNFSFEASDTTFNYGIVGIEEIINEYFQSSNYLDQIKKEAKVFVDRFSGTKTKIGIVQYSESANNNDFLMYDLSVDENADVVKNIVEEILPLCSELSNMGDALRRANYLLTNSIEEYCSKYMVVFSGSAPNKWTSNDIEGTIPKTDDGSAIYIAGDGAEDADGTSLEYAKTIGNIIMNRNISSYFIDFSAGDIDSQLEEIAVASGSKKITGKEKHFYKADSISEIKDIFDIVYLDTIYNLILNGVKYEAVLPEGVIVVEVPEGMNIEYIETEGERRHKVVGAIDNISVIFNGSEYTISSFSFDLKVRFSKPGEIVFVGTDEMFKYIINYEDINGNTVTQTVTEHFEDIVVNVNMIIDIG